MGRFHLLVHVPSSDAWMEGFVILRLLEMVFPPSLRHLRVETHCESVKWIGGIAEEPLEDGVVGTAKRRVYRDALHRMDVEKAWESVS